MLGVGARKVSPSKQQASDAASRFDVDHIAELQDVQHAAASVLDVAAVVERQRPALGDPELPRPIKAAPASVGVTQLRR